MWPGPVTAAVADSVGVAAAAAGAVHGEGGGAVGAGVGVGFITGPAAKADPDIATAPMKAAVATLTAIFIMVSPRGREDSVPPQPDPEITRSGAPVNRLTGRTHWRFDAI